MDSLVKERDQSDIMIINNFEVQSQMKSSNFQSKLQQSIQNIRQLTKPYSLNIEPQLQPLNKPELETPIKKRQYQNLRSDEHSTIIKGNKVDLTQNIVQNQFEMSYSYRKKERQIINSTDYKKIFEIYHHSCIVQLINSFEECFKLLVESSGAQLLRIPTNLILEILIEREELQHQCIMLRRKLYQIDMMQEQYERSQQQNH